MDQRVRSIVAELKRRGTPQGRDGLARFGIVARKVFGVSVADIRGVGKSAGRDHALALALWKTGWHEARMLTAFVDEPARVTPAQMDRWAKDFENWADCDALCFHLFDRTPHAWDKVEAWSRRREEFVRRAAFALLASIALHDKQASDAQFLKSLRLIERAADDERNFVKKAVSWALRGIGKRNPKLRTAALATARRLSNSESASARWIGRDAIQDIERSAARARAKAPAVRKKARAKPGR